MLCDSSCQTVITVDQSNSAQQLQRHGLGQCEHFYNLFVNDFFLIYKLKNLDLCRKKKSRNVTLSHHT